MSGEAMTIDMTPTDEGYKNILAMFEQQVIEAARKDRKEAVTEFLTGIKEIHRYLWFMDVIAPHLDEETLARFNVKTGQ